MPVGSKYSSRPTVISKQATKAFSTADVPASRERRSGGEEQGVAFALMVALRMKMGDELGHGSVELAFTEQDEMGEALLLDGADPAFRKRVQIWTSWRKSEAVDAL